MLVAVMFILVCLVPALCMGWSVGREYGRDEGYKVGLEDRRTLPNGAPRRTK